MTTATETLRPVDIQATKKNADEWFQNDEWGQAVGRFKKLVINFELYRTGWHVEEVTEHLGPKAAAKDFAREVRLIQKANA